MKRILLLILFYLPFLVFSQEWDWAKVVSSSDNAEVFDVKYDGEFLYASGRYNGELAIDGNIYPSFGSDDLFLIKAKRDGTIIWVNTAGGLESELAPLVGFDESGNVFLAGSFRGTCYFGGESIVSADVNDGFVAKYTSSGGLVWVRRVVTGPKNDRITGLAVKNDGTIVIAGLYVNEITFDDGVNPPVTNNDYVRGGFAASFSDLGDEIQYNWSKLFNTTSATTIFRAISVADNNTLSLGGALGGSLFIDEIEYVSKGSGDILVVNLNSDGSTNWVRTGGSTADDQLNSIYAYQNDVYTIGYIQGTGTIDSTATSQSSPYVAAGADIIAARYNADGRLIWKTVIGGSGWDSGYGIQIHENMMVCSGYFSNTVTFNESSITSGGGYDTGFFVFDIEGNPITAGSLSGELEDRGQGVIYDGLGNTYIAGYFASTELKYDDSGSLLSFDPPLVNASSPSKDGFLAKYQNPFSAAFTTKTNVTCNGGSNGELTVTTYFGTAPYTYSWTKDGSAYGSNTNALTDLPAGDYEVTVTDDNGKIATTSHTITQPTAITDGGESLTHVTCPGGSNGSITINPSGGTGNLTYFWTTDDGSGLVTSDQNQTGLTAGTYCLCITDENGCQLNSSYTITQPDEIVITGTVTNITNPGSNGAVTITGITGGTGTYPADFSYSWSGPNSFSSTNEDISALSDGGAYTITVTDDASCTQDKKFNVVDEQVFSVWVESKSDVTCNGSANGEVEILYYDPTSDPSPTITYTWEKVGDAEFTNPGIANPTTLEAGTYKVTVDFEGSVEPIVSASAEPTTEIIITEPSAITATIATTPVSCNGGSNGTAILNDLAGGTSPYTYKWTKGEDPTVIATSKDLNSRSAGTYYVTVTDKNGCEQTFSEDIIEPDPIVVTIDETPVACYGGSNGQLSITNITGGNGNFGDGDFNYLWSNTLTTQTITNLKAGTFSVTVTDSKGCKKTETKELTQNPIITASFSSTPTYCPGGDDGEIIVESASGGFGSLTYSKDGTNYYSNTTLTAFSPGEHTIWIKDDNACTKTFAVNVDQPTPFSATANPLVNPTCPESNDGSIAIDAAGGTGARTYTWTGPSITDPNLRDQANLLEGTYTLRMEDERECKSDFIEFTLASQYSSPTPTLESNAASNTICAGQEVVFTAGGGAEYLFRVNGDVAQARSTSNQFTTTSLVNNDAVTVDVFSEFGCMATSSSIDITVNPLPEVLAPADFAVCAGDPFTLNGSGADTYTWDNGVEDGVEFIPTETNTYTVTGTATATGCENTAQVQVTVNPLPTVSTPADFAVCAGYPVTLNGSGADTYTWDNGVEDGVEFIPTETTTYTVTGTATATGCENTAQVQVTVNPLPTVTAPADFAVCAGDPVTLNGSGADTYTWDNGVEDGVEFIPTETTTYTVTGTATATGCENTAQVQVTVNPLPTVTAPADFAVCAGDPVTINGSGADTYTWDNGVEDGVEFTPTETTTYTVVGTLTSTSCESTDEVTVSLNPPTVAGEVTGGSNICEGSTSAELTLTGYTGSVIRWEKSVDPFDTWTEIIHTQDTYTSNPLVETTRFRAVVQSGVCEVLESNYTEVEVTPAPIAGTISGDNIVCSGSGPVLTLEGYDGQIIKWSRRPEGSSTWQSTAETNATFYAPTITQSTQYRVEVDRGVCSSVFTDVFTVDVEQPTQGGEVTGGTSICEGASSEQLVLANHLGDVVRWQSSVDNGNTWIDIANTATTYTSGALAQTTQFRAVIQNGVCNEEPSLATTVTVNEYPTPTITNASSLEVCEGESISIDFSVDIDNADSYQWFKDDVEIADATQSTYTATQVGKYSVDVVLNGCLGTSNELTVSTIPNPTPVISTTDNLAFCEGEDISVGFTVDITDATSYQWMLDGAPISGATETTYTATEAGVYSVEVIVNSCSGVSNEQTVVVNPLPTVTAPDDFAVCAGESVTLNVAGADSYTWDSGVVDGESFTPSSTATYTVTGTNDITGCSATDEVTVTVKDLPTPVIATTDNLEICSGDEVSVNFTVDITNAQAYQWLLNGSPIDGATSSEYTAVDKGTYSVEVTVDGCTGSSNELIVSTVDLPTPTISAGSSINICEGNNINVELTVDIDDADAYQWLYNGQVIGSGTQQTYTAIVSGTYSAEVVVGGCMGVSNGIIIAKIDNPRPRISTGDELTYYYGEAINVLLDADITDAEDYQWFKDDVAIVDANSASYAATEAGIYYVEVVVNGCMGVSNTIEVIQHDELNPEIFTTDPLSWCADEEISVNLAVNLTTADSYQWYINDEAIPDAVAATYTAIAAGVYKVEVTLGDQTAFSNVIEVISVPNPTPTISTTDPLSWCTESDISVLFTADITDADAYQWYNGEDPISGATLSSYTATEPGDYSVEVVVSGCAGVSNQITILQSGVLQPTLTAQGETEFCEGDDVAVPLSVDITDAAYVWMLDGAEINGADQSTYTATAAGVYTVEVTQGSCSGVSNEITIVVNPVPNPVISTTDNLTWGEDEEISVTFTVDISDADAYQWLKDGANIANSIESSYTATEVGKYSVLVTKANCVGESNELTIEISTTPLYDVTLTVLNSSDDPVANAEVEIEGESPVLTNASGVATLKMPNGSYNFDVNAADYQEYQGTFTVSDEDLAVSVKLVAVGVDLDKLSQLNLFPNPFNNEIKISDPETVKRVVITNVAGQKVLDIQLNGADRINTQSLSSGVYLLRIITNDDQSATFRMVKDN
jgi:uncharacterized lipoprotein NlpE involved in copper resistance